MAVHQLSRHFETFFSNINPSATYEGIAANEHESVRRLLEDPYGPAGELGIESFLQGSYRNDTSIHSINDVDIVGLCTALHQPGPGGGSGSSWDRDRIFGTFAAALTQEYRYRGRVRFGSDSMCVKVDLEIKVEILPAVMVAGTSDSSREPFRMWDPDVDLWIDGYAREHRRLISEKNQLAPLFKPIIKSIKHLRDIYNNLSNDDAISFHLECLLYRVVNDAYNQSPADALARVLRVLADFTPQQAAASSFTSPCGDKVLFSAREWSLDRYTRFHEYVQYWARKAEEARDEPDRARAIDKWRDLLSDWFPLTV